MSSSMAMYTPQHTVNMVQPRFVHQEEMPCFHCPHYAVQPSISTQAVSSTNWMVDYSPNLLFTPKLSINAETLYEGGIYLQEDKICINLVSLLDEESSEEDELYMGSNTNISTPNNLKRKRKVTFADEKGNNFPLVRIAHPSSLFPHDIEFDISPDNEDRSSKLSWMTWHWASEPAPYMGSGLPFDMLNSHQYDH